MKNFIPKWSISSDKKTLPQDGSVIFRITLEKEIPEEQANLFVIGENEEITIDFNVECIGNIVRSSDYEIEHGTDIANLHQDVGENGKLFSSYSVSLKDQEYAINADGNAVVVYIIKLSYNENGIYDVPQYINVQITDVRYKRYEEDITVIDTQVGKIDIDSVRVDVDMNNEFWVTPSLNTYNGKYAIGELSYGAESRLFVQAMPTQRKYDSNKDVSNTGDPNIDNVLNKDFSPRVFVPVYEIMDFDIDEIDVTHDITDKRNKLFPNLNLGEETPIPDYPIINTVDKNGICSFYMREVAKVMSGAGVIIPTTKIENNQTDIHYYYGFGIPVSLETPLEMTIITPSTSTKVDLYIIDGEKNILAHYNNDASDDSVFGLCDIYGNVYKNPTPFSVVGKFDTQTLNFVIVVKDPNCSFLSFNIYNPDNPSDIIISNSSNQRYHVKMSKPEIEKNKLYDFMGFDGSYWLFNDINKTKQPSNKLTPVDPFNIIKDDMQLYITGENGQPNETGLHFNYNGQILQTCLVDDDACDIYFKIKIRSIYDFYTNISECYNIGKRFKAYQCWVAPENTLDFNEGSAVKPFHCYMLKDTSVYPYTVKTIFEKGVEKLLFEEDRWLDLGVYNDTDETLTNNMLNGVRYFRFIMNSNTDGSGLSFLTDADLGIMRVGEYFGHTKNIKLEVESRNNDIVSFILDDENKKILERYNIRLTPDGYFFGTVYATEKNFNANDIIDVKFTVQAVAQTGKQTSKEFNLNIARGFNQNYISANIVPSRSLERQWFDIISHTVFTNAKLFMQSDSRFGLQRLPRMLLKENFYSGDSTDFDTIEDVKLKLRDTITDSVNGAYLPNSRFKLQLGNYRLRSAIDVNGDILYDVLYREVLPYGFIENVSTNPYNYYDYDLKPLLEIHGLRGNIMRTLGEDIENLTKDPDDMEQRAIVVGGVSGLSENMTDTLPRHMVHPYDADGALVGYIPIIPVAYLQPGTGEDMFNRLLLANEHKTLLNEVFEVTHVEFGYFINYLELDKNIESSFRINLGVHNVQ